MYFVFAAETQVWRNHYVQAQFREVSMRGDDGEPQTYTHIPEYAPFWWDCKPYGLSFLSFTFVVHSKAPMPDNYNTGTEFDLYSEKLIDLVRSAGVRFETFPAILIDANNNTVLPVHYQVFHLLELHPALDTEKTVQGRFGWRKLVLTAAALQDQHLLFRVKEAADLVLIHQELKETLEKAGVTGCSYTPVVDFRVGLDTIFGLNEDQVEEI